MTKAYPPHREEDIQRYVSRLQARIRLHGYPRILSTAPTGPQLDALIALSRSYDVQLDWDRDGKVKK